MHVSPPTRQHCLVAANSADVVRGHLLKAHVLAIEQRTAREIVLAVRTAEPLDEDFHMEIRGRQENDRPGIAVVTRVEIREALRSDLR